MMIEETSVERENLLNDFVEVSEHQRKLLKKHLVGSIIRAIDCIND